MQSLGHGGKDSQQSLAGRKWIQSLREGEFGGAD